jgi:hypothetical protein
VLRQPLVKTKIGVIIAGCIVELDKIGNQQYLVEKIVGVVSLLCQIETLHWLALAGLEECSGLVGV